VKVFICVIVGPKKKWKFLVSIVPSRCFIKVTVKVTERRRNLKRKLKQAAQNYGNVPTVDFFRGVAHLF